MPASWNRLYNQIPGHWSRLYKLVSFPATYQQTLCKPRSLSQASGIRGDGLNYLNVLDRTTCNAGMVGSKYNTTSERVGHSKFSNASFAFRSASSKRSCGTVT